MHTAPAPFTWAFDTAAIVFLIALLVAYLLAVGPLRPRYQPDAPTSGKQIASFIWGWVLLTLTLISPLDTIGRYYSFAAHTAQLFLIITLIAPLLMMGLPDALGRLLLPTRRLREIGRDPLFNVVAVVLFNLGVLIWHAGPIYEIALHNTGWHDAQMLTFLVAGILTWWPLLTPADEHVRMASPLQILYLAAESIPLDVFGIFTIFAAGAFYSTYQFAPRVLGLSAAADQQLGGAILAVPGNAIDLILMSVVFFGWVNGVERRQREHERVQYGEEAPASGEGQPASQTSGGD